MKTVPLRKIGWAFLLAWVFCVFYTEAAGPIASAPSGPLALELFYVVAPVGASVTVLAAIVLLEPRFGAPTQHPKLIVAAPILTSISTPLMYVSAPDAAVGFAIFLVGSVLTGIGSALLWVMWGEYYAVIPREESELLAPLSSVSAALLVLLVSATSGWVSVALAALFPLVSGLCFHLSWTEQASSEERALSSVAREAGRAAKRGPLAGLGKTGFGVLGMFAIVSIAGMIDLGASSRPLLQATLLFSAVMMALVALAAVSGPRRISLPFLYRWMCPLLVIGFASVILFGDGGIEIAAAASLGGRFTFCLIAQVYFASYAASGRATPAQSSSLGWLFVHTGDLVGGTIALVSAPLFATMADGQTVLCVLSIVALVCITMLSMGSSNVFLHREGSRAADLSASGNRYEPSPRRCGPDEAPSPTTPDRQTAEESDDAPAVPLTHDLDSVVAMLAAEHGLTPREAEVFALLARGRSIPYIRDELIISRETAATHAKHIYAKLGVHSRQELINLAEKDADGNGPHAG